MKWSLYPCRLSAQRPDLHVWRVTAVQGWHVCAGCGVVGVCTPCFAACGITSLPKTAVPMTCPTHAPVVVRAQ